MAAYYNEFDAGAAAWLRELIKRGLIADGIVDDRSILEVQPDDLRGYTQCHFFAGIGGWSYALRLAGWPDDRPVWTGSPPCQPFSAAGRQKGKDDERHLAPHWATLIAAGRPPVIFGEQVASAAVFGGASKRTGGSPDGEPEWAWIDDLFGRLETARYACGAVDLPAAGVGAAHIRQRTFFGAIRLADAIVAGLERQPRHGNVGDEPGRLGAVASGSVGAAGATGGLADADCERHDGIDALLRQGQIHSAEAAQSGEASWLADADNAGRQLFADVRPAGVCEETAGAGEQVQQFGTDGASICVGEAGGWPSADHGGWADADWLFCRDGKWRPVEPGTFPLAHGIPARVVRLRGYGNAIVPQAAAVFIKSMMEIE